MEIIVLTDNVVYGNKLLGEHGLSFLIKINNKKILFDTGQSDIFLKNSKFLEEELSDVDYVVLSHGHYDHTGGLTHFLKINKKAKVIMKKKALDVKYSGSTGSMREVGFRVNRIHSAYSNEVIYLKDNYKISNEVEIITNIGEYTDFENDETNLFIKKNKEFIPDPFEDELFLVIKENEKINIITGCAHRGIINICKTAVKYSGIDKINLLMGGTHIKSKSQERIAKTVKELKDLNIENIVAGHCTGIEGYMKLKEQIGEKVQYGYTGMKFEF